MNDDRFPGARIHPSALVEEGVRIGAGSAVWDHVHLRHGARVGESCIIGEKTYVAYDVRIGDRCKLNAAVYVCAGVTIADDCMISAHVVFTNDLHPRAFDRSPGTLATSEPTEETLATTVERGVTIGANATVGPGVRIGEFSMIGMGAVVTRDVPPHALFTGNPARLAGVVCVCGPRIATREEWEAGEFFHCDRCGRDYERRGANLVETGRTG